jgi:hypothetical protein
MRVVAMIPHHTFKISVFSYNAKYIVKIEWGQFEQSFKIAELDVNNDIEEIRKMMTEELLENTMRRFITMQEDWSKSFKIKNNAE